MKTSKDMKRVITKIAVFSLLTFSTALQAQNTNGPGSLAFDNAVKTQAVNNISSLLEENYVFPDVAKKMGALVRNRLTGNAYDTINDPQVFAMTLTADLQSISHDKHLRVMFSPENARMIKDAEKSGEDPDDKWFFEKMKRENYGFRKTEILNGNIGYIDIRNFAPADLAKETIASAMQFVSGTDAIIFDLRQNGGGDPDGVRLLCSYLFGKEPVHMNDIYSRQKDETKEFWTLKSVDGEKRPDVPVYVLTSHFTFSGAEEFAYDLKNQKRATIVGEVTGGGANPGGMMYVNNSFVVFVPRGRAINPITKTNWEGVGVQPDVNVPSEKALEQAEILALQKISSGKKDGKDKNHYQWMIDGLQGLMDAPVVSENTLKSYEGSYEDRIISFDDGCLFYQRKGRPKYKMTPISQDTFAFKDIDYFRVKFNTDSGGKVTSLTGMYDDGHTDESARTN